VQKSHCGAIFNGFLLVQHCGINGEYSTCLLRQHCVAVSQRWSRIASILRLALTQKSGTVFTVNSATLYW